MRESERQNKRATLQRSRGSAWMQDASVLWVERVRGCCSIPMLRILMWLAPASPHRQSHALGHHVDLPPSSPVRSLRLKGSSLADAKSQVSCLAQSSCERLSRYCLHCFGGYVIFCGWVGESIIASLTATLLGCNGLSCMYIRVTRSCSTHTLVSQPFHCTASGP